MDWTIHDNIWIIYDNMVIQYGLHNINHPSFPSFPEVSLAEIPLGSRSSNGSTVYLGCLAHEKKNNRGNSTHVLKIINDTNKNLERSSNVIKCAYQFARCSFAGIYVWSYPHTPVITSLDLNVPCRQPLPRTTRDQQTIISLGRNCVLLGFPCYTLLRYETHSDS